MDSTENFAGKPIKPFDWQCCGQGCRPCVFDVYEEELSIWQKKSQRDEVSFLQLDMSTDDYTNCEITRLESHCLDTYLFHFQLPKNTKLTFKAGQHVIAKENVDSGSISRPYTVISQPGTVNQFSLLIKTYQLGAMSAIIRNKWVPGYQVACRGPIGSLPYQENSYRNVILIAAGTGIAPLYQLAKTIVNNEEDETRVTLLFSCRSYKTIPLREEIHSMQSFWNFSVSYFLSDDVRCHDEKQQHKHDETVYYSRLTEDILLQEMNRISKTRDVSFVYLCGSKTFEKEMASYLKKSGIDSSCIVTF